MTEEIRLIVEKNLPAQVGDVLKVTLDQAKKDAQLVELYRTQIKSFEETIREKNSIIDEFKKMETRNAALDVRENSIKEKERVFSILELEYKLASEKEKTEFTKSIAMGLVKNTEYRKTIFDSENSAGYTDSNGVFHYPAPVSKSFIETKHAE